MPWHILAPRRGCFSNHLPLCRVRILVEYLLSYGNEVSYTIIKAPQPFLDRLRCFLSDNRIGSILLDMLQSLIDDRADMSVRQGIKDGFAFSSAFHQFILF